jgi:hypothetical protein
VEEKAAGGHGMKSNYRISNRSQDDKRIREVVKAEIEKERDRAYEAVQDDVLHQVFAVCCVVLYRYYGFGKKRLQRFKECFEAEADLMEHGVLGKEYTTRDCEKWLLETMGIDLNK